MAFKLTVILLVLLFAVLRFGGRESEVSPFAEMQGAQPDEVLLGVTPFDSRPAPPSRPEATPTTVNVPPTRPPEPPTAADNSTTDAAITTISDTQPSPEQPGPSALDMIIMNPSAARDSLTLVPNKDPALTGAPALTQTNSPAPAAAPEPGPAMAEVTGSSVNLRAGPSTGNAVLGRARQGDLVEWVADPAPGWAMIRHPDIQGDLYISSQFLRRVPN